MIIDTKPTKNMDEELFKLLVEGIQYLYPNKWDSVFIEEMNLTVEQILTLQFTDEQLKNLLDLYLKKRDEYCKKKEMYGEYSGYETPHYQHYSDIRGI